MNDHSASATHDNRVCIIGCGRVGMASAYALIQSSFIRELVLVGRDRERTEGEVMALEETGLPTGQIVGTGTLVDTARLRGMLAEAFDIEPRGVDAYIIGEHGDSEVAVWSGARIAGVPLLRHSDSGEARDLDRMLERVRRAAPEVVRRKGHTEYAIGLCVQRICEAVLRNEHAVIAVSTVLDGEYGRTDVCLGTPCVVGKNGIERIIELDLDEEERKALHRSAETLRRLNPRLSAGAA
jgi:L-lactate dehydrogenase